MPGALSTFEKGEVNKNHCTGKRTCNHLIKGVDYFLIKHEIGSVEAEWYNILKHTIQNSTAFIGTVE
jgi:hypothetical protein